MSDTGPLPSHLRPVDDTPLSTAELPATPLRDRSIPAPAWREAPPELLSLGDGLGGPGAVRYVRRIGAWLLWRAGPPSRGETRYLALRADDLSRRCSFRLTPDGAGTGTGPGGTRHVRFRTWKEDLRDSG